MKLFPQILPCSAPTPAHRIARVNILASGLALILASSTSVAEPRGVTSTAMLSVTATESGQPIILPRQDVLVEVSTLSIAPDTNLPEENISFSRYAYVLAGNIEIKNTRSGKLETYKPGDFIILDFSIEGLEQWRKGRSIGAETAKLLIIDHAEKHRGDE